MLAALLSRESTLLPYLDREGDAVLDPNPETVSVDGLKCLLYSYDLSHWLRKEGVRSRLGLVSRLPGLT